ncbi:Dh31 (predicted) [Pycnogonum litorale]
MEEVKVNQMKLYSVIICLMLLFVTCSQTYPTKNSRRRIVSVQDLEDRDLIMEILNLLDRHYNAEESLENSKRGLDLGLARGFSGSQQAKHLMGMAAAKYPQGPGRK